MAKKRKTREEKIRAQFRRDPTQFPQPTFSFVKGEFDNSKSRTNAKTSFIEKSQSLGQSEFSASTSHDLIKTFAIATFIFALELVLYFAWKS